MTAMRSTSAVARPLAALVAGGLAIGLTLVLTRTEAQ